jgi:Tol biopolymer transport system component
MPITTLLLAAAVALQLGPAKRVTNVQDAYPMLSPDGTRLVFESNRTGNWDIYTMKPDGTDLVRLTDNPAADVGPIWSPDGKRILFDSERDAGDPEIYVMNADGSNQRRLTRQPGDDSHPHWSPDGLRIVFNSARTTPDLKAEWTKQYHEIFTMATDGSDVRQITRFKTVSTYPQFSPDGKKIAFRRTLDEAGFLWDLTLGMRNSEVFVMNADGSNPVDVSKSVSYDGWPVWSPDGTTIVFSSNRAGPVNIGQLYAVDPDGGNLRKLTDGPGSFVQPSFSRDGKHIYAFQHWETEEFGNLAVFEMLTR